MTYTALFLYSLLDNDHFEGYEGFLTGILFAFYCIKKLQFEACSHVFVLFSTLG